MALVGRLLEAPRVPGRHPRPARLAASAAPFRALGRPNAVLGRDRREHGLDGQPLHQRPEDPQRRRVLARRRRRAAPRSLGHRLRPALPRGVRRRAAGDRRHRGEPAPHRALRLLVRQGPALGPARHAAPTCWSTATPSARSSRSRTGSPPAPPIDGHPRPARHRVHRRPAAGRRSSEIDSTTLDRPGQVEPPPDPYAMEERAQRRRRGVRDRRRAASRRALIQLEPTRVDRDAQRRSACRASSRSPPIRCCTPTRRACSTSSRTRATRARWSSATATQDVWINPPPVPLTTPEMDALYELPFTAAAAPAPPARPSCRRTR